MNRAFLPRNGARHRGRVAAHGLLFADAGQSQAELVQWLGAWSSSGDSLWRVGDRCYLQFALPRFVHAELAPGDVVVVQHDLLTTFPLSKEDTQRIAVSPGALVSLEDGELQVTARNEFVRLEPKQWLDVGTLETLEVRSLGAPPATIADHRLAPAIDVRRALGVPALSEENLREHEAIRRGMQKGESARARAKALLLGALSWLNPFRRAGGNTGGRSSGSAAQGSRFWAWLSRGAVGLLGQLGLLWAWLLPQQRYLRQLDALFERGDVLEALRRALPLGGAEDDSHKRIALTPPGRREDLSLTLAKSSSTSVLPVGDAWQSHLRKMYERAFQKLERDGDVEHAAFVLAELLADVPRAIQWLERHGRVRLAAELAEARGASAGEKVRLWFLAGETARAEALAVRHRAFADAVSRLEQRAPEKAQALRLVWANHTAESGGYLEAARIAWSVKDAEQLVSRWLELSCGDDGPAGYAAWVARLAREPGLLKSAEAVLAPVIGAEHQDGPALRNNLAQEVLRHPSNDALDALTRPLLRGLLRDRVKGSAALDQKLFEQLLSRDALLRADVPRLDPSAGRTTQRTTTLRKLELPQNDCGTMSVRDAVAISGGRTLVALGELGAMLLSRTGSVICRWQREPVDQLVPSRDSHVITLSHRSEVTRLGRLDIATRRSERWIDLALRSYVDHFDGTSWYVVPADRPATLMALDTLSDSAYALWQVDFGLAGGVLHLTETACDVLLFSPSVGLYLWSYGELPTLTLRSRAEIVFDDVIAFALAGDGRAVHMLSQGLRTVHLSHRGKLESSRELPSTLERLEGQPRLKAQWPWLVVAQDTPTGTRVDVVSLVNMAHLHSLQLDGANRVTPRFSGNLLVVSDNLGRIVRVDLERETQTVLRV